MVSLYLKLDQLRHVSMALRLLHRGETVADQQRDEGKHGGRGLPPVPHGSPVEDYHQGS